MATRPQGPLSKAEVIAEALRMIDADGLEQLSLRKLGAAVGVQGMSLYHLFKDKGEILDGVALLILRDLTVPEEHPDDVVEWSLENARRYRAALLAHPNAIPLFLDRHPARGRAWMYEEEFAALSGLGVPERYWLVMVETLEAYVLGAAMFLHPSNRLSDVLADTQEEKKARGKLLRRALRARTVDEDQAFENGYVALLTQLLETYGATVPASRRARRR